VPPAGGAPWECRCRHRDGEEREEQRGDEHPGGRHRHRAADDGVLGVGDVGREGHVAVAVFQRGHRHGDLEGPREVVRLPAHAEPALHLGEEPLLRFPQGAVGQAPLHGERFGIRHPLLERLLERGLVAGDDAGRGYHLWSRPAGEDPAGPLRPAARGLLVHRLPQEPPGDAHLGAELQEVLLAHPVARVHLARLKLGGALDDPLQGGPVDPLRRQLSGHAPRASSPAPPPGPFRR
jgi:hypothetical protein